MEIEIHSCNTKFCPYLKIEGQAAVAAFAIGFIVGGLIVYRILNSSTGVAN